MKRQDLIRRATRLATEAANNARRYDEELALIQGPARPGDVVVIPTGAPVIHWLIVKAHPDDAKLLFAVPADDNPEIGCADIAVPNEHPWGPMSVRCGFGIWLDADLLDAPRRTGVVSHEMLAAVRMVLGQLVAGTLQSTSEQILLDSDLDFLAWLAEVDSAREAASAWLAQAGQVVRHAEMATEVPSILRRFLDFIIPPASAPGLSYAAEGGGLRGRISRRVAATRMPRWLPLKGNAGVHVVSTTEGVRFVWTGSSGPPPLVRGQDGERFRRSKWNRRDGVCLSETWAWSDGSVVFRIGPGNGRKVVIRWSD